MIFRAEDMLPKSAPVSAATQLSMYPRDLRWPVPALPPPVPAPLQATSAPASTQIAQAEPKPVHHGFIGNIKGFFAAIFR